MLKSPYIFLTPHPEPYFLNPARQHRKLTHTHPSQPARQPDHPRTHTKTRILRHDPPRRPQPPKTHRHPIQKPLPLPALLPPAVALGLLRHLRFTIRRAGRMQRCPPAAPDIAHERRGAAPDGVTPPLALAEHGRRSCCCFTPHGCKRDG